jgi:hypothetical protein
MRTLLLAMTAALAFAANLPAVHAEDAPQLAVVHFSKLTPLLGDIAGWEGQKVDGNTLDAGGMKLTTVERRYKKGAASAEVSIVDYSESAQALTGLTALWNFSSESAEGYQKSITIEGAKGWETYENASKKGELFLLVAGRYMISIQLKGLPAPETQAWAKNFNFKKLAEVK